VSSAEDDQLTTADIDYDDNGNGPGADDVVTVAVKNGGHIAGPRTYVVDTTGSTGIGTTGVLGDYGVFKPTDIGDEEGILIAKALDYSYNGFVESHDAISYEGNIGAGFGGETPTGTASGEITYLGYAATETMEAGEETYFYSGSSSISADFTNGSVEGTFDFSGADDGPKPTLGFTDGTMSTNKATYSSTTVTYNSNPATGKVIGGFFGPNYIETAGAFDIQSSGGTKALGSFGATSSVP
jgi:hypothetical protein